MRLILLLFLSLTLVTPSYASCRSSSVKKQFDKINGYPKGRKGYVVDHWCPLFCGGIDDISNMKYQTIQEGKEKDKWEITKEGCKLTCNKSNSTPIRKVFNCK